MGYVSIASIATISIVRVLLLLRLLSISHAHPRKLRHHTTWLEARWLRPKRIVLVARLRRRVGILGKRSRLHLLEDVGSIELVLFVLLCLLLLRLLLRPHTESGLLNHHLLWVLAEIVVACLLHLHAREAGLLGVDLPASERR